MKRILVGGMALVLLGITLLWPPQVQSASGAGGAVYNEKCALCHGARGDGKGPGAALSPKTTDFTNPRYWQTTTDQKIAEATLKGVGVMPGFSLNSQEMKALIEYMRTFKK